MSHPDHDLLPSRYLDAASRMQLFHQADAAGVVFWQPAGLKLYEKLRAFVRSVHRAHGYEEVKSPSMVPLQLFERSGHLAKYKDLMFLLNQGNGPEVDLQAYGMRPMSCPNHIVLYQAVRRSYRELPVRFFEFGEVFRNEPSGSLQSLFRLRQFCQDDSHVFADPDRLFEVLADYLRMAQGAYRALGFERIDYCIALRPAQRFGDDAQWDRAEDALRQACRANGMAWAEEAGGGAFYGPKIELHVQDKLGRSWQLGVIQLDYVLPDEAHFDLSFVNAEGGFSRPVILHHAVLGSLERMIGILLESFGVDLPLFLQPHEAVVLPVSERARVYAERCHARVQQRWPDALIDRSDEPLGAKIRRWKHRGVPHVLVVGEQEALRFEQDGVLRAALERAPVDLDAWLADGPWR